MKKISCFASLALLSCIVFTAEAAPLTPEEALSRIDRTQVSKKIRGNGANLSLKYSLGEDGQEPALYVFAPEDGEGFLIAGGDDCAFPLLGYSDSGHFDADNIPSGLRYWLREYSGEISQARSLGVKAGTAADGAFEGQEMIAPLLKTKWNQGSPYNRDCFMISADGTQTQSVTGCVATAMAQVMYYFQYPATGHGEISYSHGDSGTYKMNFADRAFDWSEMLPTYSPGGYTEVEADAVAYLMKACGYSVKMDYSKGESGADGALVGGALINYFGYSENIELQTRAYYTYSDWVNMIYDNLRNVGPVVYNGSALDGGHSFVCDGYDGNGYFHINWGWGGMSDGYYLLDALNPDEFGIGGAAGGYNLGQQVILNISPKTVGVITPQLMQFGNVTGKIADGRLSLSISDTDRPGFQYINPSPITLTFGVIVENESNPAQQIQYFESDKKNLEARESSFFRWDEVGTSVDLSKVTMTEGDEYRFAIATYVTYGSSSEWTQVVAVPGKYNYVTVKKTASGYEIVANPVGDIRVSDFEILSSPVYWNKPVRFSAAFANGSSAQLTRNYSAVFFNSEGKESYKMENYSVNVDAGETVSDSWTSINWYKEDGAGDVTSPTEFTVRLYDNWQGIYLDGIEQKVTVQPESAKAEVESELTVLNGEKKGEVYMIEGDSLEVSLHVKVTAGVFNHTIMLALQEPMADGDYETVMHKHFDAIPDLTAGQEAIYEMTVQFSDLDFDKTYRVEVWGPDGGFNEKVLVRFTPETDGVATLSPDATGRYTVYGIDGCYCGSFSNLDFMETLPGALYIINGRKILIP